MALQSTCSFKTRRLFITQVQDSATDVESFSPMPHRGVGGTVASESALIFAKTLLCGFKPRHRRPGLTEGLKA
ncbi:hypothetical protein PoB_002255500 [Plakobranchus ocellatus]|uniref:Uncharacterized protein n=1 Tax=Plakobranchus ocellatus TaxID=259542 RepID=A0AAV3ZK37_9GAST|nr:hypothetical protein PoB_002255500 [Plakobranchus ocellatus]